MFEIAHKMAPHARHQHKIARLADREAQPAEHPKDAQGTLCPEQGVNTRKLLAVKAARIGITQAFARGDLGRDIATRVLQGA